MERHNRSLTAFARNMADPAHLVQRSEFLESAKRMDLTMDVSPRSLNDLPQHTPTTAKRAATSAAVQLFDCEFARLGRPHSLADYVYPVDIAFGPTLMIGTPGQSVYVQADSELLISCSSV